jgi:hypothetical protein
MPGVVIDSFSITDNGTELSPVRLLDPVYRNAHYCLVVGGTFNGGTLFLRSLFDSLYFGVRRHSGTLYSMTGPEAHHFNLVAEWLLFDFTGGTSPDVKVSLFHFGGK